MSRASPQAVSFVTALRFWLKLGCVSFGGPAGQIALMHSELVERRRWISNARFVHALNYCMLLPGPEAQQLATYIGWLMHGTRGALAAGILFVAPSLVLLMVLSWIYMALGQHPVVAGVLWAVKPAVVAIVAHAAWRIGKRTLHAPALIALAAASFVAIYGFDTPFPLIVLCAALAGALGARVAPAQFRAPAARAAHGDTAAATLIDDHSPLPEHTRPSRTRLVRVVVVVALLWTTPLLAWTLFAGWHSTLAQMAWFFSKAALLTFGGAYAVLPYVVQGAVEHYGWLSTAQMMDGLALGESTPGPLIMVVTFVGFVGGWQHPMFGPDALLLSGIAAACVATYYTFLPSFAFILAGAPLVESSRHLPQISAPLSAITAAVVGVIANLALFFAVHVFWPQGLSSAVDGAAVLIAVVSLVALIRFKPSVLSLIGACAVVGVLRSVVS